MRLYLETDASEDGVGVGSVRIAETDIFEHDRLGKIRREYRRRTRWPFVLLEQPLDLGN